MYTEAADINYSSDLKFESVSSFIDFRSSANFQFDVFRIDRDKVENLIGARLRVTEDNKEFGGLHVQLLVFYDTRENIPRIVGPSVLPKFNGVQASGPPAMISKRS